VSKRTKIIAAVVVLVAVAGVAAFFLLRSQGSGPDIKTATVAQTNLGVTVSASGKVQAGARADVYPPTPGTIAEVYVTDGAIVKAGEKLAIMDTAPLETQLAAAESGLAQARSARNNIGAQAVGSSDIAAAKASVASAKAAWEAAKKAGPSSKDLAAANAAEEAARLTYNNAVAAYDAAKTIYGSESVSATTAVAAAQKQQAYAGWLSAQSNVAKLAPAKSQSNAGTAQAYAGYLAAVSQLKKAQAADPASQRAAADAAVSSAAQAVALAQNTLDNATLVAPLDGVVFFNALGAPGSDGKTPQAAAGAAVAPQAAPFSVVDLQGATFTAEVDEADIDRLKVGMKATVTLDAFAGKEFKTTVVRIKPAAQPTATGGTVFPVELAMTDTGKNILIGMKGDATIEVSSITSAITIPLEALFNENGKNFVYKVVSDKLVKTDLTVGATTDVSVEVLKGLAAGDVVALSGPTQYTDGMSVRVKN
jgi:HlyD family secretion protein